MPVWTAPTAGPTTTARRWPSLCPAYAEGVSRAMSPARRTWYMAREFSRAEQRRALSRRGDVSSVPPACRGRAHARVDRRSAGRVVVRVGPRLAEREDVGARARVLERDLEGARRDSRPLADELVHPRLVEGARAGLVDVDAVGVARRRPVEADLEADGSARRRRCEDEVEVARLEAEGDRRAGRLGHRGLLAHRPRPVERPLVEREAVGSGAAATLAAVAAEVGLGRAQGAQVGRLREAARVDVGGLLVEAQQRLEHALGLLVRALAEVLEARPPVAVDDVHRRPVPVVERAPDREVVVDDDRVTDAELPNRPPHVVEVVLEAEL